MLGENERDELRTVVLHRLVSELDDAGKTKLQKLTYFLQEALGLPLGFQFRMLHYGPYSYDLDDKLSEMKLLGYLKIEPDPSGYGYHVTPTETSPPPDATVIQEHVKKVSRVVEGFGKMAAAQLELRATIHFVRSILGNPGKDAVLQAVKREKPKFSNAEIAQAYNELDALN